MRSSSYSEDKYRLEVERREGEVITKDPGTIRRGA
jgi:hypothetical protein